MKTGFSMFLNPFSTVEFEILFLFEDFLKNITNQRDNFAVKFPDKEDLNGAAVALMRLQDTYRLSTADMVDGTVKGFGRTEYVSGKFATYL